ncbi:MAG: hypothetical protein R3Y43_03660 [Alphaproteobacteria bacterium]
MKKTITSILCMLFISACNTTSNSTETYEAPRFLDEPAIKLNVNSISTVSEFTPSFRRPNVEHLFPNSLEKVTKIWVSDRLKAVDLLSSNEAIVTIKDASVTEELIKSDTLLKKDSLKYKAKLYIEVAVKNTDNLSTAQTEIQAWRELTIPADTPIAQKEKYWNSMVEKLFDAFNTQMNLNIDKYLSQYVEK